MAFLSLSGDGRARTLNGVHYRLLCPCNVCFFEPSSAAAAAAIARDDPRDRKATATAYE